MRCEDLQNYFADYLAGSLAEPLQSEVLEHFESCAVCSEEADALQRIWASRGTISDQPDSAAMRARYDTMLAAYRQSSEFTPAVAPRRRRNLRRQVLQVLIAMTVLGIGVFAAQRTGLMVMTLAPLTSPGEPEASVQVNPPQPAAAPVVQPTVTLSSIEGTVLRAGSNEPIAGAQVSAFWAISPLMYSSSSVPRVVTDREGRFVIQVETGNYRLSVVAGGYASLTYGMTIAGSTTLGVPIVVSPAAGKPVKGVVIHLTPSGVISGRITTANGEPLLGMEVVAFQVAYEEHGHRFLKSGASPASTDDRGQYRLSGLAPGRYYVRAGSSAEVNLNMGRARVDYIGLPPPFSYGKYTTVYYPQESEVSTASTIEVQPGAERAGLNFVLARQSGLRRVRGWITDPAGEWEYLPPKTSVRLTPYGVYVYSIGGGVEVGPDGKFDIHDVIPGKYWLTTVFPPIRLTPEQRQLAATPGADYSSLPVPPQGQTVITVGNSDIDNAVIAIARNLSVSGRIQVDGEATSRPAGLENIKLEFLPASVSSLSRNIARGKVEPNGTFTYTNIWPSEYLVWVSGLPPDAYLKEGRVGDIDLLTETVLITRPMSDPLTIVLGAKGGQINGTLTNAQGATVAGKQVKLVPSQATRRRDLYKTATTDRNGRFTIRGIAPGDYSLYAWENIEAYRYFDPDYVKQFETAGTAVRVGEGASVTAGVRLIP